MESEKRYKNVLNAKCSKIIKPGRAMLAIFCTYHSTIAQYDFWVDIRLALFVPSNVKSSKETMPKCNFKKILEQCNYSWSAYRAHGFEPSSFQLNIL